MSDSADVLAAFADPPDEYRPVPIWWWSGDRLETGRLRRQLDQMQAGGIREFVVLNLAPSGPHVGSVADDPEWFSEAWWSLFTGVCDDARDRGMRLWFYDQLGFSGSRLKADLVAADGSRAGWELERRHDGAVEVVRRGFDYLSAPVCAALLDAVHGELARRCREHLGATIRGTFQDELPSLPTWSARFAEEFEAQHGYALPPRLDHLYGPSSDESTSVRRDYQATRARLAEQALFEPLAAWHAEHGLLAGFDQQHPARAGYPIASVQAYADYFRTHRWYTAPGSDHWGDAKVHSSMAHHYRRPRVWVEAFHSTGWGGTLEETFDWLLPWIRAGATLYDPHAVYYSARQGWWEWAPPSTCWRQPYWRHYPHFAEAVARLCAVMSLGAHRCDVAVLFPTATVQADLALDAPRELFPDAVATPATAAERAHQTYLDVVGTMHWYSPSPGVLDRDRRDFDVIDDDTVVAAVVDGAALCTGEEAYRAVVLPACVVLDDATAAQLSRFVDAGGTVVAVGALPRGGGSAARLAEQLHAMGWSVGRASDLPAILAPLGRRIDAPVPTLERVVDTTHVLFLQAAWPGATALPRREPRTVDYDFDARRYADVMEVVLEGPVAEVEAWDPVSGGRAAVTTTPRGDATAVTVEMPGPVVLLVWDERAPLPPGARGRPPEHTVETAVAGDDWEVELVPTLGEAAPDLGEAATGCDVAVSELNHRRELPGEDGLALGWHRGASEHVGWEIVHAGFGPRAEVRGPVAATSSAEAGWRPAVYSLRDGPWKQERSRFSGGGFVPEEFIVLGEARPGDAAAVRVTIGEGDDSDDQGSDAVLTIGSAGAKTVRWNGEVLDGRATGYHWSAPVTVGPGENRLEIDITAATAGPLRASWGLCAPSEWMPRPEWLEVEGAVALDLTLRHPTMARLRLGGDGPLTLWCNGEVVGRQGDFEHYEGLQTFTRLLTYDLAPFVTDGPNRIVIESRGRRPVRAVVDGEIADAAGRHVVVTGPHWSDDGSQAVTVVMSPPHDSRYVQLLPRPHPLPSGGWLDEGPASAVVAAARAGATDSGVDWFRLTLPPGCRRLRLPLLARLFVGGQEVPVSPSGDALLDDGERQPSRPAVIRVDGPGVAGGGRFPGPVPLRVGTGSARLGDWSGLGLGSYSGGVRYRGRFELAAPLVDATLDLGAVRGTAELRVDGAEVGARFCSPYVFDLSTPLMAGTHQVEVTVYNTLGPHLAAHSPTGMVGEAQLRSGLYGPVRIFGSERAPEGIDHG